MKPAFAKAPPLTADEMREMRRDGQSVAAIAEAARRRNGIGRADVRRILFGEAA